MENRMNFFINVVIALGIITSILFIKIIAFVIVMYYIINYAGKAYYQWKWKQRIINNHKQKQNELVQEKSNSDKD